MNVIRRSNPLWTIGLSVAALVCCLGMSWNEPDSASASDFQPPPYAKVLASKSKLIDLDTMAVAVLLGHPSSDGAEPALEFRVVSKSVTADGELPSFYRVFLPARALGASSTASTAVADPDEPDKVRYLHARLSGGGTWMSPGANPALELSVLDRDEPVEPELVRAGRSSLREHATDVTHAFGSEAVVNATLYTGGPDLAPTLSVCVAFLGEDDTGVRLAGFKSYESPNIDVVDDQEAVSVQSAPESERSVAGRHYTTIWRAETTSWKVPDEAPGVVHRHRAEEEHAHVPAAFPRRRSDRR